MEYLYKNCPAQAKRVEESRSLDEAADAGPLGMTERGTQVEKSVKRRAGAWSTTILVAAVLATVASAQVLKRPHDDQPTPDQNQSKINAKSAKKYPRAIGVLEFLPGGAARLVPVALWIDDRFYDASLYGANPAPMAVEPETVYEATNYGERIGLFTITNPEELKGTWIAAGKWKPRQALDEKLAAEAAKQPKPKPTLSNADDERPTLKRPGESGSSSSAKGASGTGSGGSSSSSTSAGTASGGAPPAAEDDPNRPTLKKPPQPVPAESPTASSSTATTTASGPSWNAPSPDENDPNRPVLRRGKLEAQAATPSLADLEEPKPSAANGKAGTKAATITHSYPAVSDAGPFETRSLLYAMNDTERASKTEQMSALALDEIRKFVAQRHTPALSQSAVITSSELRSYDLDYHNNPTIVFTAALPVPGAKAFRGGDFSYFVTVVAHEDFNGLPIKIFSAVTDSNRLDAFPRMEIIDAVDADANGRGDLLFRQYSDTGISYSLYRVYPYNMQKVFEGGAGA